MSDFKTRWEKHIKEMRKTNPNYAKAVAGEKFKYTKAEIEALVHVTKPKTKDD